ncbi:hypothetical protein GM708_12650 [Vibrio cholerae]|nr:hypothetical protein [Vibrio cholerae]
MTPQEDRPATPAGDDGAPQSRREAKDAARQDEVRLEQAAADGRTGSRSLPPFRPRPPPSGRRPRPSRT